MADERIVLRGAFGSPSRRGGIPPKDEDEWCERVKAAIAVNDGWVQRQGGVTYVLVPAETLLTVQVAAAFAADHPVEVHRLGTTEEDDPA
jgi:hypothetical protein